jgi:radical SAM PhpK family P-methyltransferase
MTSNHIVAPEIKEKSECIVIGYNEEPFPQYERLVRSFGKGSVAYRDLHLSFLNINSTPKTYVDLLNYFSQSSKNPPVTRNAGRIVSGDIPNLAAVYLVSFLIKRGVKANYINLFQLQKDALEQYLHGDPYCVAITTTFYVLNQPLYEIVEFVRRHNDRVKIVVGGPLIANHNRNFDSDGFQAALKDIGADIYVVDSQGEDTLYKIVKQLQTGGNLAEIPNIVYVEEGILKYSAIVPENNSMDDNYIDWLNIPVRELGPTVQTRTARSCAFNCSFCNYPSRAGTLSLANLTTVERELDLMVARGGIKNIAFIDDTFNVPLKRFKDLCRLMIRKKYSFNWFSYFRCSNSDDEAIELMADSGCKGVFLGIESGSSDILRNMHKVAKIDDYRRGIELLKKRGILTFASLIIGFPGETDDTVRETREFIRSTEPDYYRAQVWYCEPGTPIMLERNKYQIEREGFVWKHGTMNSRQAMTHVEEMLCSVTGSIWLPQWSFDFWIIPYLLGKGITFSQLKKFLKVSHQLLALEIGNVKDPTLRHTLLNEIACGIDC